MLWKVSQYAATIASVERTNKYNHDSNWSFKTSLRNFTVLRLNRKQNRIKKKVDSVRKIIYDACISYAGEQSDYAQRIFDNLRSKGITVFFDKFYEGKLWGRDLSEYFMNVYYKQSKYCIMLISKEYVSKAWPTHERRSAIARNIEEMGEYILPVRFDKSEVPGLPPTIKYLDATKKGPEEIAALFIGKLQGSDKEEQAKV